MTEDGILSKSPSESRALLLALARRQAASRSPRDLLSQWTRDATVRPSAVDLRTTVALDAIALDVAAEYEGLLLAPVAPLGVNSVVAPTSQDRTLTTTRTTEVVSDPTNVLAVESAHRLLKQPGAAIRLCTAHQTLRMQGVTAAAGRSEHFRLFALADAGRAQSNDEFEVSAVTSQLRVYSRLFDALESGGRSLADRRIVVRVARDRGVLGERILSRVASEWPEVALERVPSTRPTTTGSASASARSIAMASFRSSSTSACSTG